MQELEKAVKSAENIIKSKGESSSQKTSVNWEKSNKHDLTENRSLYETPQIA